MLTRFSQPVLQLRFAVKKFYLAIFDVTRFMEPAVQLEPQETLGAFAAVVLFPHI